MINNQEAHASWWISFAVERSGRFGRGEAMFFPEAKIARIFNAGNGIVKGTPIGARAHPDCFFKSSNRTY
jgi:hypothetical protein